eukprot:TRINITY_DN2328_c0_g1_i2.p1 TRINITY_DN2328_c0_g1~~TRINITY_DN2328_c0_g1_i2.p1  ORF type:complete len:252 (+),score=52.13 TRINITY_DN2328_c0_g1_i2:148-903(+)
MGCGLSEEEKAQEADDRSAMEARKVDVHKAAKEGNVPAIKFVCHCAPSRVNEHDRDGDTPLHHATLSNQLHVAQKLIKYRADPNSRCNRGDTPLHRAGSSRYNNDAVAKLLLISGAEVNAQSKNGSTPLHEAADHDVKDVVRVLLQGGADKELKDQRGETALDRATFHANHHVITLLKGNQPKPSTADSWFVKSQFSSEPIQEVPTPAEESQRQRDIANLRTPPTSGQQVQAEPLSQRQRDIARLRAGFDE